MIKKYGILGYMRLLKSLIYTKLRFPKARLLRLPFDIRNRKFIDIGNGLTTGFGCRFEAFPIENSTSKCLIFGSNIEINDYVHIAAAKKIIIGNNVLIASKVFISDINHGNYSGDSVDSPDVPPNKRKLSAKPIIIEDNVWIGEGVCVMAGVRIGLGSIIGASAVVTKDVPSNSIAVGNPARVVKVYNFENGIWEKIDKNK
nr:DapH/DapD/GlmU-related protein [Pedobacter panaciterrae]